MELIPQFQPTKAEDTIEAKISPCQRPRARAERFQLKNEPPTHRLNVEALTLALQEIDTQRFIFADELFRAKMTCATIPRKPAIQVFASLFSAIPSSTRTTAQVDIKQ